jgi:hypothetical protein
MIAILKAAGLTDADIRHIELQHDPSNSSVASSATPESRST